ncbi:MAG: hypothetical protein AAF802_09050 [Planctomycetota bacterium]
MVRSSLLPEPYTVTKSMLTIGMTTLPAVSPGEPICHLGMLPRGTDLAQLRKKRREPDALEEQIVDQLATNLVVFDRHEAAEP